MKIFNESGIATSIYIDPSTNITHFGYSIQWREEFMDSYEICYRHMDSNGQLSEQIRLTSDPRLYRSTITGAGNGKNLYITAFGPRNSFEGYCSEQYGTDGCYDIYFTESADNGKTWTKWRQLDHGNQTDIYRRLGETTFIVKETGRMFVFYSVGSYEERNAIGFVTKPKDSSLFSRESIIATRGPHYVAAGIGASYTYDKGTLVLHVCWEELWGKSWAEYDNIYYSQSRDMGIHWSEPRAIAHDATGAYIVIPVAQFFSNPSINPSMLFFVYSDRKGLTPLSSWAKFLAQIFLGTLEP